MDEAGLIEAVAALLARSGLGTGGLRIEACAAGGNNRVHRVYAGGRSFAAKRYVRRAADARDRLATEFAFLAFARSAGIECVPAPIARDDDNGIGLYEFVEGRRLEPGEIGAARVDEARDFFLQLNRTGARALAASLTEAAEARFSIAGHIELLQARIERLARIPAASPVDEQALAFAAELRLGCSALRERVLAEAASHGLDPQALLPPSERCVSPSDFGFHNAILTPGGKIVFVDFEYAGWDDPAKAVSDFFSQPALPVPAEYFEGFLASAAGFVSASDRLVRRTRLLLPVFRLKWCCIVMNVFLPAFAQRSAADPDAGAGIRKQEQLDKARQIFRTVGT